MTTTTYLSEYTRGFETELSRRVHEKLNFIQVLLGARQVGKTTAITHLIKKWPSSVVFETADDLSVPNSSWIELHWRRARELPAPVLLVFDEIQKVPDWSEKVKMLFDHDRSARNLRVVLLGSASLSIDKGLSESLTGRFEVIRAPHWDFYESKQAFGWGLEQFLQFGGYPAGAELIHDEKRWQQFLQQSVLSPVISKDILGLTSISKPALFRQTFELCLQYPAQEISLNKILGSLQDKGNVTTIRHYLDLFEGAFLLKTLQKYSGSRHSRRSSIPKILPLAPALVHAIIPPSRIKNDPAWKGRVFELAVGATISRMGGDLYYWREGNAEVDYVLELDDVLYAIEVKSGRKKNSAGLQKFITKFPKAIPILIDPDKYLALSETLDFRKL
jgi:uncharacterized protein